MTADLVERARLRARRAAEYMAKQRMGNGDPSSTLEWELADEIERLRKIEAMLPQVRNCLAAFMLDTLTPDQVTQHEIIKTLDALTSTGGGDGEG